MSDIQETREHENPWEVLGVAPGADAGTVRRAYLEKLRQYPPDRAPEAFERIRDAYESLNKPGMRVRNLLSRETPVAKLVSLIDDVRGQRVYTGPKAWLAALTEK